MSIWFRPFTLEEIQQYSRGSMTEHLDLRFTEIGPDYLRATMPVDHRTVQPFGLLHESWLAALQECGLQSAFYIYHLPIDLLSDQMNNLQIYIHLFIYQTIYLPLNGSIHQSVNQCVT